MKKRILILCIATIVMLQGIAQSASYPSIPNTFKPRQLISSSKIMANYNALLNGIIDGTKKINVAELYMNASLVIDGSRNFTGGTITASGNATNIISIQNNKTGAGSNDDYNGINITMTGSTGTLGQKYGIKSTLTGSATGSGGTAAGIYSLNSMNTITGTNLAYGVWGECNGTDTTSLGASYGVYGKSAGDEANYGVWGLAAGTGAVTNYGVYGIANTAATTNYGIYATATGGDTNYAAYLDGPVEMTGTLTLGVATANATTTTGNTNLTVTIGGTTYYIKANTAQ